MELTEDLRSRLPHLQEVEPTDEAIAQACFSYSHGWRWIYWYPCGAMQVDDDLVFWGLVVSNQGIETGTFTLNALENTGGVEVGDRFVPCPIGFLRQCFEKRSKI